MAYPYDGPRFVVVTHYAAQQAYGHNVTQYSVYDQLTREYMPVTYNNVGDANRMVRYYNRQAKNGGK